MTPEIVIILLVMISWFVQTAFPVESFDFFYHLATGRWIAENLSIPTHDVFSSTARGDRWITHEWAVQLALYLGYKWLGISGLVVAKAVWLALAAALLCALGKQLQSPPAWTLLLVATAAPTAAFRAFLRPHIFGWGFLIILLYMLYGNRPQGGRTRTIAFALLFLIWANCHSGFVFGFFIMCIFQVAAGVASLRDGNRFTDRIRSHALPLVVSAAASMFNPNLWHVWQYPFLFMKHRHLFGLVSELRPLATPDFRGGWFISITYGFFAVSLAIYLIRLRHGAARELILFVVFAWLAATGIRNVPEAIIVILPGLMLHGGALLNSLGRQVRPGWIRITSVAALLAAAGVPIVLTGCSLTTGIPIAASEVRHFGVGIKDLNYPDGAVRYLKANSINGHYLNTFAFGGYLLWTLYPDPDVFIDGRLFVYIGRVLNDYRDIMSGAIGLDRAVERYGVTHLVLSYAETQDPSERNIYAQLLNSRTWIPVFWDDVTMVFIREGSENAALLNRDGYRAINPLRRTLSDIDAMIKTDSEAVYREAARAHDDYPRNTGAAVILGRYHALRKEFAKSVTYYDLVLSRHPGTGIVRRQRALVLMEAERFAAAEADWTVLSEANDPDGFTLMNRGICLHRMQRREEAVALYRRAYTMGYRSAELMNGLGIYYAEAGNMPEAIEFWRKGLAIDPDHEQLRHNLERANRMQGARM